MTPKLWQSILNEGLGCLDEKRNYKGRKKQSVTLANKPKNGAQTRVMEVSPHLTIWLPINTSGNIQKNIQAGFEELSPIHEWLSEKSQSKN